MCCADHQREAKTDNAEDQVTLCEERIIIQVYHDGHARTKISESEQIERHHG